MIYQIVAANGCFSMMNSPGWYFLVESISLAIFGTLVILMVELLLTLALLTMLIAGFLLYQFTRAVGTALLLCAQHLHNWLELPKFPWWINRASRPAPKITILLELRWSPQDLVA
jgi:hypothetical protein